MKSVFRSWGAWEWSAYSGWLGGDGTCLEPGDVDGGGSWKVSHQLASNRNEYQESLKNKETWGFLYYLDKRVAVCLSNVAALTSRNPMGLHGL
jgi:hypothetical protein